MINERHLLNWLRNYQFENYAEIGHEKEYDFIENLIRGIKNEPKVGEWILCSDRLPEEDETVLITTKAMDKVYCGTYTKRYGFSMREGFICDYGFMWLNTALAWMPLPEPYKEQ